MDIDKILDETENKMKHSIESMENDLQMSEQDVRIQQF